MRGWRKGHDQTGGTYGVATLPVGMIKQTFHQIFFAITGRFPAENRP